MIMAIYGVGLRLGREPTSRILPLRPLKVFTFQACQANTSKVCPRIILLLNPAEGSPLTHTLL
jgi:hypothetical protein